jgi:hypothetical protein
VLTVPANSERTETTGTGTVFRTRPYQGPSATPRAPAQDASELAQNWRVLRAATPESRSAEQRRVGAKARPPKIAMFSETKTSEKRPIIPAKQRWNSNAGG